MRRSQMFSAATAAAALALAASTASAQLVFSFETLYDSTNTQNPSGTEPDDFTNNGSQTTITQSNIGVTNGAASLEFAQNSAATFTGAITNLVASNVTVPGDINSELIDDPNTVALSVDVTIPATGNFTGAFARMGISEFGVDPNQGVTTGTPVQTIPNSEVNIDQAPGTYHFTIPLIGLFNPITGDSNVSYSSAFGTDSDSQLTPTSFEFYINKPDTSPLTVYLDNVQAIGPATDGTWSHSSGGSWNTLADWSGGIPQLALDTANLTGAITVNSTVTLDGNRSVEALNFNNGSDQYTIAQGSGGTLTLDAGGVNTSTITDSAGTHSISAPVDFNTNTIITVSNAGNALKISGPVSGIGSLTVQGNGTVELSGAGSYTGGTTVSSGTLLVGAANALPTANSAVNISAGAKMQFLNGIGGVTLQAPNITAGGTLDIGNNHLFIDYTTTDPIATIVSELTTGYHNGTWTGTGITSSAAAASSASYGIGYADSTDLGNPANLPSGTIEIAYTLLGDANLDGKVNGTDFTLMSTNFNDSVTNGWDKGDFNYSGTVNGSDFLLLAGNFNQFASQADVAALDSFAAANGISLTNVPEPASGVMALGATVGTLAVRRKRQACIRY